MHSLALRFIFLDIGRPEMAIHLHACGFLDVVLWTSDLSLGLISLAVLKFLCEKCLRQECIFCFNLIFVVLPYRTLHLELCTCLSFYRPRYDCRIEVSAPTEG